MEEEPTYIWDLITALVVSATLVWTIVVGVPKMRRKLSLLSYEIKHKKDTYMTSPTNGQRVEYKWTELDFAFSNTGRRTINPIKLSVETFSGETPTEVYFVGGIDELKEGEHGAGFVKFKDIHLDTLDLKSINIHDSMGKKHDFYFFDGEKKLKWVWKVLNFLHVWRR